MTAAGEMATVHRSTRRPVDEARCAQLRLTRAIHAARGHRAERSAQRAASPPEPGRPAGVQVDQVRSAPGRSSRPQRRGLPVRRRRPLRIANAARLDPARACALLRTARESGGQSEDVLCARARAAPPSRGRPEPLRRRSPARRPHGRSSSAGGYTRRLLFASYLLRLKQVEVPFRARLSFPPAGAQDGVSHPPVAGRSKAEYEWSQAHPRHAP